MTRGSLDQEIAGKKISDSFYWWLSTEIKSSDEEVNTFLSEWENITNRIKLGYNDENNWASQKDRSHLGRLPFWWEAFAEDPNDDYQSARLLFSPLMFISGAYRHQCYMQAKSPREYDSRRKRAVGINLRRTVADHLTTILPRSGNFSHADINLESLGDHREAVVSGIGGTAVKALCERVAAGHDLGEEDSPSVQKMIEAQQAWVGFATECVTLAAKIRRGQLEAVPFLEPKSITLDPKVIYPLAEVRP